MGCSRFGEGSSFGGFGTIRANLPNEADAPPGAGIVIRVVKHDDPQPRGAIYDEVNKRIVLVMEEARFPLFETELVEVKPMEAPQGLMFFTNFKYPFKEKK